MHATIGSRPAWKLLGLAARAALVQSFLGTAPSTLAAQVPSTAAPAATDDLTRIDGIVSALYDVISGSAGQKRNWDRFRSLFAPGARLIPTGLRPDGTRAMRVLTPEDYITGSGPLLEGQGFFEQELGRKTLEYGGIAHLFSAYEARHRAADSLPFMRGVNSIQLAHDGRRWWILSILWASESPSNPIPADLLRRVPR